MQFHKYVWNDNKNIENIKKHGINFDTALKVFDDPNRVEYYDYDHSNEEDRYCTIGMIDYVVYVVYTMRSDETRLISARRATNEERKKYYAGS